MNCSCHSEQMYWNRDPRRPEGGFWYCAVKQRERQRAYYRTPQGYLDRQLRNMSRIRVVN